MTCSDERQTRMVVLEEGTEEGGPRRDGAVSLVIVISSANKNGNPAVKDRGAKRFVIGI